MPHQPDVVAKTPLLLKDIIEMAGGYPNAESARSNFLGRADSVLPEGRPAVGR